MTIAYSRTRYINLANRTFAPLALDLEKIIDCRSSTPYCLSIHISILSMSQFSDTYASSNYEGAPLDTLQYLIPDDTPFTTPYASGSQQTLTSAYDNSRFAPPSPLQRLSLPPSITTLNPDRINSFALYSDTMSKKFVEWWLQTEFGKSKRINWDARHQAECWNSFDQVANTKDGKPGVMCKQCRKVLDHPAAAHTGTSSMNKHRKGVNCAKFASRMPNIKTLLETAVCHFS